MAVPQNQGNQTVTGWLKLQQIVSPTTVQFRYVNTYQQPLAQSIGVSNANFEARLANGGVQPPHPRL